MLRLGSFGLVGVNADEQGTLSLRGALRARQNAEQGGKSGNVPFHIHSETGIAIEYISFRLYTIRRCLTAEVAVTA
jgi:hypothetical protein